MADGLEPICLAMVICDVIHTDPATGKRTLLGTFSSLVSPDFPMPVHAIGVYLLLTECRGKFNITLQIVDVNDEREPVVRVESELEAPDPLTVLDIDVRLGGFQIPMPGEYRVQLYADGAIVIERRLMVIQTPIPEQPSA
jgi:hypothetical protein